MNKKGFAISVILYSMVFLLITIFYMLLGITKTRYSTSSTFRNSVMEDLNESHTLYDIIERLGNNSSINYVYKYNASYNGEAVDIPSGSGGKDVYYYKSDSTDNLAGVNGNVIFGNYCWQIVRTTSNGGVKLLYNGPKTSDDTCPNNSSQRPTTVRVVGANGVQNTTISGSKLYGDSFEIFNDNGTNKFRLKDTSTNTWSDSTYENLISKYICGTSSSPTGTSDTCEVLYQVGHYQSNTKASTAKFTLTESNDYSSIGTSPFNNYNNSLALVGYMFNKNYLYFSRFVHNTVRFIDYTTISTNYYYGDKATWNPTTRKYDVTIDDGNGNDITPTATQAWADVRGNVKGKYSCKTVGATSCSTVYYFTDNSTNSYSYTVSLDNGEDINSKTMTLVTGTGFTVSGNNYVLTNPTTATILLKDWTNVYTQYKNLYVCDNVTNSTCSTLYYITSSNNYQITVSNVMIFGNDVTYSNGNYSINPSNDETLYKVVSNWKVDDSLDKAHYTCLTAKTNNCGSHVYFVFDIAYDAMYYVELKNGDKITDAMANMINDTNSTSSDINRYNSTIKGIVDNWYESHLLEYDDYLDKDAVYCNRRSVTSYGGWQQNGTLTGTDSKLGFNDSAINSTKSLSCPNITDRFSGNNPLATLKYPVGLISGPEAILMGDYYAKTPSAYYTITPAYQWGNNLSMEFVFSGRPDNITISSYSLVRPAITLKPGINVTGKGTYDEPYVVLY